MPRFVDISHILTLSQSRSRGDFSTVFERETSYHHDGTLEGKLALIDQFFEVKREEYSARGFIENMEAELLPILAQMEYT